jgi:hypothetical protein
MLEDFIEKSPDVSRDLKSVIVGVLSEIEDMQSEMELLRAWPRSYKTHRDPEGTQKSVMITPAEMVEELRSHLYMMRCQSKVNCQIREQLDDLKEERDTLACMLGFDDTCVSER